MVTTSSRMQVLDIANQTRDYCGCKDDDCRKSHIKRVADGKYEICGKNVYVRVSGVWCGKYEAHNQTLGGINVDLVHQYINLLDLLCIPCLQSNSFIYTHIADFYRLNCTITK